MAVYTNGPPQPCCPGAHEHCCVCGTKGHIFGSWRPQRLFAFEERTCRCCGHAESRVLPLGEERV